MVFIGGTGIKVPTESSICRVENAVSSRVFSTVLELFYFELLSCHT
jgi:hypothetical protein